MKKYPLSFWFLIFTELLMACGYSLSFPFLAIYLSSVKNMPIGMVGIFLAFSAALSSFSNIYAGELSDKFGRKKIMALALILRSILIAVIALVIKLDLSPMWIVAVHPLALFAGTLFGPAARAYVSDFVKPKDRFDAYGIMRIGTNAGWAAGPALGGFIASKSYASMFFLTSAVYLLCFIILLISVKEFTVIKEYSKESFTKYLSFKSVKETFKDSTFFSFCFYTFIIASVMSQLVVPASMYGKSYLFMSERQIGFLFTINGLMVVFMQYAVTRFFSKYSIAFSMWAGAVFYGIGYFMFGFSIFFSMAVFSMIIITFGELLVSPGLQALSANMAPEDKKGRYIGVHSMVQQLGNSFGIFAGSFLIDRMAPIWPQSSWLFMLLAAFFAARGFARLGERLNQNNLTDYGALKRV